MMILTPLFLGCVDMRVAMISERDAVGKPLDQVVANLKSRGLSCSPEYQSRVVNTGEIIGRVNCSAEEKAIMCPQSYQIPVSFDLKTRLVLALGKFSKTNCF